MLNIDHHQSINTSYKWGMIEWFLYSMTFTFHLIFPNGLHANTIWEFVLHKQSEWDEWDRQTK